MNKRVLTILIINLTIVMLAVLILIISSNRDKDEIPNTADVKYIGGIHGAVWREGEYIVYSEDVELENTSNYNLWGYIIADIRRESSLVKEEYVYAYDKDTGKKLLVYIPANSVIELRGIHFRATSISDEEALRSDREPLRDVMFEEVKRGLAEE